MPGRVVIVGGGFGGMEAARALGNTSAQVTVVDRTNHHLFQPLLYQVATAGLSPADIAAPIRGILARYRNIEVLLAEVVGVDAQGRRVLLEGGRSLEYDHLVLATGSRHAYFGHDEWEPYAPGLKSISDATAIRRRILLALEAAEAEMNPARRDALMTFVLVGGGPTGVEMAGAIAELDHVALAKDFRHIDPRSARILLLEAGPRILPAFADDLAAASERALRQLGVDVRTNCRVEVIDGEGVVAGGERIPSQTVIWTAGVAASPAGKWLGAQVDRAGRAMVNPDLSVPGVPDVFVVGDTAHLEQAGQLLPGVAPVAMQQGRYVGDLIKRRMAGFREYPPFHYVDKGSLATVGRSFAILQRGRTHLSGLLAWLAWVVVHIWYLIGFRNRALVLFQWAWAYLTFQRGARLIVFDDAPRARDGDQPTIP